MTVQAVTLVLCLATANSKAQVYNVLHNFNHADGAYPQDGLVLSGTTLYGTTYSGSGEIFQLNTDGGGFAVFQNFYACGLMLAGDKLYGATPYGGGSTKGTIFKVNTDGSGYAVLHTFSGYDGAWPVTASLVLSGTTLYGTTESGGTNENGTVFKVNADGSGFAVLKKFIGTDGSYPEAGVILSGTTLYGTTRFGGSLQVGGTVFKVNTDGSDFTILHSFNGSDGSNPLGGLVLSGATLYGTTQDGHTGGDGTVFKVNTDGSHFTVLKRFEQGTHSEPRAGLVLSGSTLFGTTYYGGHYGLGTVFAIETDGSGFTLLKEFAAYGSDGDCPAAKLLLSGTTLYGTTYAGGSSDCGVVFALGYPPTIQTPPQTQTAEAGGVVNLAVRAGSDFPLTCQWFFNGNAITGCTTNCVLCLPGVQATNVGFYTVIVSNCFGAGTSAPAVLNVIPPVERRSVPALDLLGQTGSTMNVEYADVLGSPTNWLPLDAVSLTGPPRLYFDLTTPLPPQRFYRVWQTGSPATPPSLNLPFMVPAITLTGTIGDSLHLDYINQFGPTDAWVNLNTVTLTNTSQLYFDTSAPGQPRRLYRIKPGP